MNSLSPTWSSSQIEVLTHILKAIAHPTRLAIIDLLEEGRRLTVTEIYTRLDVDRPVIWHHLRVLCERGVVDYEGEGQQLCYFLKHPYYLTLLDIMARIHLN